MTEDNGLKERTAGRPYEDAMLGEYYRVLWRRKAPIIAFVVICTLATAAYSLFLTNVYRSTAVIAPVGTKDGGSSGLSALMAQVGAMQGVYMPSSSSATEMVSLLRSRVVMEKTITRYNLMPVLFSEQWDEGRGAWKRGAAASWNPISLAAGAVAALRPSGGGDVHAGGSDGGPTMWDGLRLLGGLINVSHNAREGAITVSAEFQDPRVATELVNDILSTLTEHMSGEVKRVAQTNRKYLEGQLAATSDPFIKQKIYNLIAQQIETSMMSEVKENFAFKVIDPPKVPDRKVAPRRSQIVIIGALSSLFIAILFVLALEFIARYRREGSGQG